MSIDPKLMDEACDWHAALAGDDPDFDGFTDWLEASADHVRAYDAVMLLDDQVLAERDRLASALPANDAGDADDQRAAPFFRRRSFAAALAALLAVPAALWMMPGDGSVDVRSGNVPQEIALSDRTHITLDRNSVLRHDKGDTGAVELASGAAHFSVRHDPTQRFTVQAGDVAITDLGTQFEVQRNGTQVGIAVSEGLVAVALPGHSPITVKAGQRAFAEAGTIRIEPVDAMSVGSWRRNQLVYRNAPLQQVAREISRYAGKPVQIAPAVANRRFSGVLTIGDGQALDRNLADFMALSRSERSGTVWIGARP
jgi:transmembrane sensor